MLTDKNGREIKVGDKVRVPHYGVKTVVDIRATVIVYEPVETFDVEPTPRHHKKTYAYPATCAGFNAEVIDG